MHCSLESGASRLASNEPNLSPSSDRLHGRRLLRRLNPPLPASDCGEWRSTVTCPVLGWCLGSHGAAGGHPARSPVRCVRAGPAFRRATQTGSARPHPGTTPAGAGSVARPARGARHARSLAPAAVARRHVRGLRQRAQPRHQPPAGGARRRGRQPAVHRDAGTPGLPLHRAGRPGGAFGAGDDDAPDGTRPRSEPMARRRAGRRGVAGRR